MQYYHKWQTQYVVLFSGFAIHFQYNPLVGGVSEALNKTTYNETQSILIGSEIAFMRS